MPSTQLRKPLWRNLLLGLVLGFALVVVAGYMALELTRATAPPAPSALASPPLRLSGSQFLLNWQSFPGRRVVVEYCTIQVTMEDRVLCQVFAGASETGAILLGRETLDQKSAEWAKRTCASLTPLRVCSSRVTGVIRKGDDGRPVLEQASIEP